MNIAYMHKRARSWIAKAEYKRLGTELRDWSRSEVLARADAVYCWMMRDIFFAVPFPWHAEEPADRPR